ncbi:ubiquitin-conjugating enzyme/RWD-like protein [Peziza echinospora]|nr:ubiquitin-conjugating enzyme/RWD-like protein [Peziza echinospora]
MSSSGSMRRITKELTEFNEHPPTGISAGPVSDSDLYKWDVTLIAPKGSIYHGGIFHLILTLPPEYPFKPPTLSFTTKIYHPNVSNDDKGSMCLGILRPENWKPSCKILAVLEMARGLLVEPNVDDAVETSIAEQYKSDRAGFEKTVKQWVKNYAKDK